MRRSELEFNRPDELAATGPAESQGRRRDSGRLLVSWPGRHIHARFTDLADHLQPGDLLVVNRSATLPASLQAEWQAGSFTLNLSTNYGSGLWLAEPRISPAEPGPVAGLGAGDRFKIGSSEGRFIAAYPGLSRLWFVRFEGDVCRMLDQAGRPIRYRYVAKDIDLDNVQTIFAAVPGSAEMPSAAYPFTRRVLRRLSSKGVRLAGILLHTGVSSLEMEVEEIKNHTLYPEPYKVPAATARAVNHARAQGRRVVAVGTTVVRALESAWNGRLVRPAAGFTGLYIHPDRGINVVDGLLTGMHDPATSHLAMLYAIGGKSLIKEAYASAVQQGYYWHEFGDSHLIFPDEPSERSLFGGIQYSASHTSGIWATAI